MSADDLVGAFVRRLVNREEDLVRVASFWNSFEHWLKFEFVLELCGPPWERRPWSDQSEEGTVGSIGVEYKAPLKGGATKRRELTAMHKQIDLWVCSSRDGNKWHYVELKVAFKNANRKKQLASWNSDLDRLGDVNDPGADGRIALLVAVGFDEKELMSSEGKLEKFFPAKGDSANATPSVGIVSLR